MKGLEIKQKLKKTLDDVLEKIDPDKNYKFETDVDCFDGCSDTNYVRNATINEIDYAIHSFLRNVVINGDVITINRKVY